MSLQSRVSGRLAQLRAAGQLLGARRPWPGPSAGATRTRSTACGPPASLGAYDPRARTPAGVGAWGAAAVGRRAGVRTWAPLAMAAKVDLSTSTDWKEAKCKCKQEGGARGEGGPTWAFSGWTAPHQQPRPPQRTGEVKVPCAPVWTPINSHAPRVPSPINYFTAPTRSRSPVGGSVRRVASRH